MSIGAPSNTKVRKTHVLHVITTIDRGGAENHLASLVKSQRARGWDVSVAYLKSTPYWRLSFEKLGVRVIDLGLRFYGDPIPLFRLVRELLRARDGDGCFLVHAHLPPAELYARFGLGFIRTRVPLIISRHNDSPFFRGPYARALSRWVMRRSARVIAISSAVAQRVERERHGGHAELPEVVTIPYGIGGEWLMEGPPAKRSFPDFQGAEVVTEIDSDGTVRTKLGIPEDGLVVGTIARLVPQKALHVLIRGFANFCRTSSPLVDDAVDSDKEYLVIVGRGKLRSELEGLAARLGVIDRVRFVPFTEEVSATLEAFDIFALTSIYEGFGLVLLEAMARRRPVLATCVSSIADIVVHQRTGLLVPPNNDIEITNGLHALRSAELRSQLGEAGRRRVEELFSEPLMCERVEQVYVEACSTTK